MFLTVHCVFYYVVHKSISCFFAQHEWRQRCYNFYKQLLDCVFVISRIFEVEIGANKMSLVWQDFFQQPFNASLYYQPLFGKSVRGSPPMARWKAWRVWPCSQPSSRRPRREEPFVPGPLAKREKTADTSGDTHVQIHTQDNCALYVNRQEI